MLIDKTPSFNTSYLKQISQKDLAEYFTHRFNSGEAIEYKLKDETKIVLNLVECTYNALQQSCSWQDFEKHMQPYIEWTEYYICKKQDKLALSIHRNTLLQTSHMSPRKTALQLWSTDLYQPSHFSIQLEGLVEDFKLEKLINGWKQCWDGELKYTQEDVKPDKGYGKTYSKEMGFPKDYFEFKRRLKKKLQDHQSALKDKLNANPQLQQYSLEVSKYLMRYFPLKKSGKKLAVNDIEHYLALQTITGTVAGQINNAVRQYIIQQGKKLYYDKEHSGQQNSNNQLASDWSSQRLQTIKVQEAFALQFIDACAFATNNLRNCLAPSETKDILGKNIYQKVVLTCLQETLGSDSNKSNDEEYAKKLKEFFLFSLEAAEQKDILESAFGSSQGFIEFAFAVRGSTQQIRNKIMHFNADTTAQILSIENFECPS